MRIVIDTNVLVGACIRMDNAPRKIIRMCLNKILIPTISNALYCEYESVFSRDEVFINSPLNDSERFEFLDGFLSICSYYNIYYLWRPNLKDEGDNHLIELAVASNSQYIITANTRDFDNSSLQFDSVKFCTASKFIENWSGN